MHAPRFRLSTSILLIVIVALVLTLIIQDRRARQRSVEFNMKYSLMMNRLELLILEKQGELIEVVGRWRYERSAKEALQKELSAERERSQSSEINPPPNSEKD
jgi:hypothetical protein